jgi:hypothetical protein
VARHREITYHNPAAAVVNRTHTTGRAPGPILGRLDREPPLAAVVVEQLAVSDKAVEPDQRGHTATVAFHQGPPVDAVVKAASIARPPTAPADAYHSATSRHAPTLHRGEPV